MIRAFGLSCRVLGAVVLLGFALAAFTPAPNVVARQLATPADVGSADAIVVLGSAINADGTLTDGSIRRTLAGIGLYREGLAPRIVFLGVSDEAAARARMAVALGVPREAILTEGDEPTTREEAARVAQVLRRRGERTVLLVTDTLHMRRARRLFERAGLTVRATPTGTGLLVAGTPESRLTLTRVLLQELAALAYHELFGYL